MDTRCTGRLRSQPTTGDPPRAGLAVGLILILAVLAVPVPTAAGDREPATARSGLELARDAARAWEPDAVLVYLENDEPPDSTGRADRWGYLFYSPDNDKARGYSVGDGRIVSAANLEFQFEAPPVPPGWIDSGAALEAADTKVGRKFREAHAGRPTNILLMRGAFDEKDPDVTTWTIIYTSPTAPTLFVVVDAATGKVKRKWSG